MKKNLFRITLILVLSLLIFNCKDDEKTESEPDPEVENIADEIAATLSGDGSGITNEILGFTGIVAESSSLLKSATLDTLFSNDTSIKIANSAGEQITYNYNFDINYGYVIDGFTLNNVYYNADIVGSYDGLRIAFSETRSSKWVFTGLDLLSTSYILNGTSERTGQSESKVGLKSQMSSTAEITLIDVKINKATLNLTSGTMNWKINGRINDTDFAYEAVIEIIDNKSAELTIDGYTFTINLEDGEVE